MDTGVWVWWIFLSTVAGINLVAWAWSAWALRYKYSKEDPDRYRSRWIHVWLSGVFVVVCGLRGIFPKGDVQRIVLWDTWVSSVFLGRSLATIAELCFVAQWVLIIREIAAITHAKVTERSTYFLLPAIAIAEICSWYAVITTNYMGNVIEESLWTLVFAAICVGAIALWRHARPAFRPTIAATGIVGIFYVVFMMAVDVPGYFNRWQLDQAAGKQYFSFADGIQDAMFRRVVTLRWDDWSPEIPWMSLYFSVAVWLSIAIIHIRPFTQSVDKLPRESTTRDRKSNKGR